MFVKGDIITAYHSGFHKVIEVKKRYISESDMKYNIYKDREIGEEISGLVFYTKIATKDGVPVNSKKILRCDVFYCGHFTDAWKKEVERLERIKKIGLEL